MVPTRSSCTGVRSSFSIHMPSYFSAVGDFNAFMPYSPGCYVAPPATATFVNVSSTFMTYQQQVPFYAPPSRLASGATAAFMHVPMPFLSAFCSSGNPFAAFSPQADSFPSLDEGRFEEADDDEEGVQGSGKEAELVTTAVQPLSLTSYRFPAQSPVSSNTKTTSPAFDSDIKVPDEKDFLDNTFVSGQIRSLPALPSVSVLTPNRALSFVSSNTSQSQSSTSLGKKSRGEYKRKERRDHVCPKCHQTFTRAHDLRRHAAVHSEERLFPCKLCSKQFPRKDALKRHMDVRGPNHDDDTRKASSKSSSPAPRKYRQRGPRLLKDKLPAMTLIKLADLADRPAENGIRPTFSVSDVVPTIARRAFSADTVLTSSPSENSDLSLLESAIPSPAPFDLPVVAEYHFPAIPPALAGPPSECVPYGQLPDQSPFDSMQIDL